MFRPLYRLHKYRRELTIVVATATAIIVMLLMAAQVYRVAVDEVTQRYRLMGIDLAGEAAFGLEGAVDFLSRDLLLLSSIKSFPLRKTGDDAALLPLHADAFMRHAKDLAVRGISILGAQKNVVYTTVPAELKAAQIDPALWARLRDPGSRDRVVAGAVFPLETKDGNPSSLRLLLMTPLYTPGEAGGGERFGGSAIIHVDLSALMDRFVLPISSRPGIEAWVLASDGTLIYHPSHPEMMFRRTADVQDRCLQCHENLSTYQAMLTAVKWSGTYRAGNRGQRVAATHRVRVANDAWTVVVSSPMAEVRVLAGHRFLLFFVLVGMSVAAPAMAAFILLRLVRSRSRAEAEAVHAAEMRRLEQQVNQAAKLASIGEMVDSVAHEVNNPAAIALSRCEYLTEELTNGGISKKELREDLATVTRQIERIVGITRQLLRFSRRLPYEPRSVSLQEVVANALDLFQPRFHSQPVRVACELPEGLRPVWADPQQIEQVLINLLNNAFDAIEGGGEIRISAQECEKNGQAFVALCVEDDGRGISDTDLAQILQPFFTTKPAGKGTGLGLTICQRIVKRHGGELTADSTLGQGSRFCVWLPVSGASETVV